MRPRAPTVSRASSLFVCFVAVFVVGVLSYVVGPAALEVGRVNVFVYLATLALVIQWVAFIPAVITNRGVLRHRGHVDLCGSGCGQLESSGRPCSRGSSANCSQSLVLIWAFRLGLYLGRRIHTVGKDSRFDEIKFNTPQFMTWTLQGLWTFLTLLPVLIIVTAKTADSELTWSISRAGCLGPADDRSHSRPAEKSISNPVGQENGLTRALVVVEHPNYRGNLALVRPICLACIFIRARHGSAS